MISRNNRLLRHGYNIYVNSDPVLAGWLSSSIMRGKSLILTDEELDHDGIFELILEHTDIGHSVITSLTEDEGLRLASRLKEYFSIEYDLDIDIRVYEFGAKLGEV